MDFWDFLQRWSPYSLALLYVWLSSALAVAYLHTKQKYWLDWQPFLGLGLFVTLVLLPLNPERFSVFNIVFITLLLAPVLGVIYYRRLPTGPTKRKNNPRPSHPHLLDVLLFRNPARTDKDTDRTEAESSVQPDHKRESTRWYMALGLVTTTTALCTTVFLAGIGLRMCEWLDTSLARSGCIRQFTYNGAIQSIAFSPDGQLVAFGGSRHTTEIWNVSDNNRVRTLSGHSNWVAQIAFSPDGSILATASWDRTVQLWRADTGAVLLTLELKDEYGLLPITHMAYSPDGKMLAVISRGTVDRAIWLWRVEDGSLVRKVDAFSNALAFSPDSTTLVATNQYGDLTFTDITTGNLTRTIDMHGAAPWQVWVSPDGKQIAAYSGKVLYILAADTGATIKEIEIIEPFSLPAGISPNWEYFTASGSTLEGQQLAVWGIRDGTLIKSWLASKHTPYDLTFAPDSKSIGVATSWEIARVWRVP
ncbi:MAG TPA: hypothetical protein VF952_01155 [Chloroflexia bacterium]|jgi:hypothetical protein